MPNVFVPIDSSFNEQKLNRQITASNLNNYVYNYYLQHRQQIEQYSSAADYVQRFNAAELWDGFIKYPRASMDFERISSKEKEMIQLRLKAVLARYKWRNEGFYQVLNHDDPVIKRALELVK